MKNFMLKLFAVLELLGLVIAMVCIWTGSPIQVVISLALSLYLRILQFENDVEAAHEKALKQV